MAPRGDINLTITGDSRDWNRTLKRAENRAKRSTGRMSGMFGKMGKSMTAGAMTFAKGMAGPFAALATGTAAIAAGKRIMDFDDNLLTLALNAGISRAEMMKLREEIIQTGFDARIPRDQILAAISDIVDKTGDFDFARESILGVGKATTAMAAEIEDVSRLASAASINLKLSGQDVNDFFNVIATQGNKGSFIFRDLANQAERLLSAAGRIGIVKQNFAEFGAFIQLARPSFGSAEETSTAISNIATRLKTQRTAVEGMLGYSIFDEQGKIKDFEKTITDLVKKSGGDIAKLYKIFQESSIAFTGLISDYQEFGELRGFEKLIAEAEQGTFLMDTFSQRVQQAKYSLRNLFAIGWEFADAALVPIIEELGESLEDITNDPEKLRKFREGMKEIGASIGDLAGSVMDLTQRLNDLMPLLDAFVTLTKTGHAGARVVASPFYFAGEGMDRMGRNRAWESATPEARRAAREFNRQAMERAAQSVVEARAGKTEQSVNVNITQHIDRDGRTRTETDSPNTHLTIYHKGRGNLSGK